MLKNIKAKAYMLLNKIDMIKDFNDDNRYPINKKNRGYVRPIEMVNNPEDDLIDDMMIKEALAFCDTYKTQLNN